MIATSVGLKTHIWNNNLRCIILLALYPLILMGMVWLIGVFLGSLQQGPRYSINQPFNQTLQAHGDFSFAFANRLLIEFWPMILAAVSIWFLIAWFFHTSMIRGLCHSHPVSRQEEPELYNLLENLCISQGVPMPRLEIIETHARNAFASGIDQKSYSITVTRGLMNSLARDELEGVLAHELAHIMNRDVRLLIVTVIFTGMFGFAAQLVWSMVRHQVFFTSGRRDNNGGAIFVILGIALILWLGYLATLFMRFALSRRREYMADAGAVEMTKNPEAMMRALMRIAGRDRIPQSTDDIALMCIENHVPFLGLFATHPPIKTRIRAIAQFTNTPVPALTSLAPATATERFTANSAPQPRQNPWLIRQRRE